MRHLLTATIAIAILSIHSAFSVTRLVPAQYQTIQSAMTAALDGDTVLVSAGVYNESVDFLGKSLVLKSVRGPETTMIDPNANAITVNITNVRGRGAVVQGFTLTNFYTTSASLANLHGINCFRSQVTIKENIIRDIGGIWSDFGAGIKAVESIPTITNNIIQLNECIYFGAGIFLQNCPNAVVKDNTISENRCNSGYGMSCGGGMYINHTNALIEHNVFYCNWTDVPYSQGSAISLGAGGRAEIYNNAFLNNQGPCIYQFFDSGFLTFINNIITATGGMGIYCEQTSNFIDYNDLYDNVGGNYFGCQPGPHDISLNPLLDPERQGRLLPNSPCIDAGDPNFPLDPDSTIADIGAFYFDQAAILGASPVIASPAVFKLEPPYPNPGNSEFNLHFTLPSSGYMDLSVYDISGRMVETIIGEYYPAGNHSVVYTPAYLASGVYFVKLQTGNCFEMEKLIYLK